LLVFLSWIWDSGEDGEKAMQYQCINCKTIWGEGRPETEGYSHGLCGSCLKMALTPIYRRRQTAEGNFDCFATSCGYCDQNECKYRQLCLQCK
jgi:hypothetical protein